MIRVLIIDDEKPFRSTLKAILSKRSEIDVIGEASGVEEGLLAVATLEPELIFLDVQMEDGTGFDLLKRLDRRDFRVIFITAYDHYAVEAFRFSAVDYLLKPIISNDLFDAIDSVKKAMDKEKLSYQLSVLMDNIQAISKERKKIVLREAETLHVIHLEEILWCEADGSYTYFYLTGNRKLLVSRHLKEFEDILTPNGFFRAHRSHLVNLNKIIKFERADGGTLFLEGNIELPVSVRKKERLTELLAHL
jgi:two-component system, LytTR family, response regulator